MLIYKSYQRWCMHRKIELINTELFNRICELSNPSKFKIIESVQEKEMTISLLSKKVNLAFNKCSNYCTELEKHKFISKKKEGKNVFVKSKINLKKLKKILVL